MSRDLNDLVPSFQPQIERLLGDLLREGFQLRPFFTLRHPREQARLWRQSRTIQEIHTAAAMLSREGAEWLRELLLGVGPQSGKWATNALPGQSWHQWGEAVDCYVLEHGRAVWRRSHPGYERYAILAKERGLTAGFFWRSQDAVHIQRQAGKVRSLHSWAEIDQLMRERFSGVADSSEPAPVTGALGQLIDGTTSLDDLIQISSALSERIRKARKERT